MHQETVIVLDFGGQYNQLIARRVRECKVYCEILPYTVSIEKIREMNPRGIIFTGGPNSVYDESSPHYTPEVFELGIPVLGICYGCQLMAYSLGGNVVSAADDAVSEYGKTATSYSVDNPLFEELPQEGISWMSHRDYINQVPEGFRVIAATAHCPVAAMADEKRRLRLFHAERTKPPCFCDYFFEVNFSISAPACLRVQSLAAVQYSPVFSRAAVQ